jgi:hypothetical protein
VLRDQHANQAAVVNALRPYRGTLIQTTVSPELEEELKRAGAHQAAIGPLERKAERLTTYRMSRSALNTIGSAPEMSRREDTGSAPHEHGLHSPKQFPSTMAVLAITPAVIGLLPRLLIDLAPDRERQSFPLVQREDVPKLCLANLLEVLIDPAC